jgi:hypothetical protein
MIIAYTPIDKIRAFKPVIIKCIEDCAYFNCIEEKERLMANFYGTSRTSYFKVKDEAAFKTWADSLEGVRVGRQETEKEGVLCCLLAETESGEFPCTQYVEEDDGFIDSDFPEGIASHLEEGWACTIIEVGAEKLHYVQGYAAVVTSEGVIKSIELNDWAAGVCESACVKHTSAAY